MDELAKALENLKLRNDASIETTVEKVLRILKVDTGDEDSEKMSLSLVQGGILPELEFLLKTDLVKKDVVAEIVAELAKTESVRVPCVEAGIVPPLANLLVSQDVNTCTQTCRALGNICFDNDLGRDAVDAADGMQNIITLMKQHLATSGEECSKLRMITCGFLLNLTNENESLQQKAVDYGALTVLNEYLNRFSDDDSLLQMAVLTVSSLVDVELSSDLLGSCTIAVTVAKLIQLPACQDQRETLFEILVSLAENDLVKVQLAKTTLPQYCVSMINAYTSQPFTDELQLVKTASDVIILILTGDDGMNVLYDDGKGVVYKEALSWLRSEVEEIRSTGVLAIGNFARNDNQCVKLVHEDDVLASLLPLLKLHDAAEYNTTTQHVILSTIRNLAIPASNKPLLIQHGVLDLLLPLVHSKLSPVIFKLVGVLRMIIMGQEEAATKVGTNTEMVQFVIQWSEFPDHEGIKGEASRLLAWLVKHSRASSVMQTIADNKGLPCLVQMLLSEHAVMQNEGMIALTLIASSSILESSCDTLLEAGIISTLEQVVAAETSIEEIKGNACSLIAALCRSGKMKDSIKNSQMPTSLQALVNSDNDVLKQSSNQALGMLNT